MRMGTGKREEHKDSDMRLNCHKTKYLKRAILWSA